MKFHSRYLLPQIVAITALGLSSLACSDTHDDYVYRYTESGFQTKAVALANVSGDGKQAVVSANILRGDGLSPSGFVTVRLQDPNQAGHFQSPIETTTEDNPIALSLVDFSGKGGAADLVLAHRQVVADPAAITRITIQKSDPSKPGHFLAPTELSLGTRNPSDVATGDLNGDDLPDIAVAADGGNSVVLFIQNSDGTFTPQTVDVGGLPNALAMGDLNHDGFLDLVVANTGGKVDVLLQDSGNPGTFLTAASYAVGSNPVSVKIAALSDPDYPDILTANFGTETAPTRNGLSILAHDSASPGQFLAAQTLDTGDYLSASVAVGNPAVQGVLANAPYIVVANMGAPGWPGSLAVFRTNPAAAGTFLSPELYEGVYGPNGVAVGDVGGNALVAADGGTFLRFEVAGSIGIFGDLIQLYQ